jgi:DNA polymerase III subunit epsilon
MPDIAADKLIAEDWARQLMSRVDWCILDTETTGLGVAEIVEIAIAAPDGQVLVNTLVKPQLCIEAGASKVHGIFDADVADAPMFPDVYPTVKEAIAGREVVIYNAPFDTRMLNTCCGQYGLPGLFPPDSRQSCAMKAYAQWVGDWNDQKGGYRWHKLDGGHRALGDCLAVLDLIKTMAEPRIL